MLVDDIIVRINETPTSGLTHLEANALLKHAGNNFMLGIIRLVILSFGIFLNLIILIIYRICRNTEEEESLPQSPITSPELILSEKSFETSPKPTENEMQQIIDDCNNDDNNDIDFHQQNLLKTPELNSVELENEINNNTTNINTDDDVHDDLIAEIISGEAEVLKDHNVLG